MMDGASQKEGCGIGMVQERAGGGNGKMEDGQPGQMRGLWDICTTLTFGFKNYTVALRPRGGPTIGR